MVLRAFVVSVGLGLAMLPPGAAVSETVTTVTVSPEIAAIARTMMIGPVMDVLRAEGMAHSADLSKDLLEGQDDAAWQAVINLIYNPDKMTGRFNTALAAALGDDAQTVLADSEAFFGSPTGQRALTLEIEARMALLDAGAEAAAKDAWLGLAQSNPERAAQIERFAVLNDLIESNVMGALNANLDFFRGLSAAGAFGDPMPEEQMLTEVWAQEPDIRTETTDWLYPFLMLSYQSLSDAELQEYIDFSASPSGQKMNAAVFVAFDAVMRDISGELGAAAGRLMVGQDI